MPNDRDTDVINELFDRIESVARQSAPRDVAAERLIQQRLTDYPPAPYYMAQTIVMQEQALRQAQERIEQLEASQRPSGGFLGGLFGNDAPPRRQPPQSGGPWNSGNEAPVRRNQDGGSFMAGAAQTAMGVAGGVLLGNMIAGMFSTPAQAEEFDAGADLDDQDLGGGSDFDFGGDF